MFIIVEIPEKLLNFALWKLYSGSSFTESQLVSKIAFGKWEKNVHTGLQWEFYSEHPNWFGNPFQLSTKFSRSALRISLQEFLG